MDGLLEQPAVVLVCLAVGSLLLLAEVALPTVGLAGTGAAILGAIGVAGIARQDATWWPLLGVAAGVSLLAVLIARRTASTGGTVVASSLFGAGALAFGLMAEDGPAIAVALGATAAVTAGFQPLLHAAIRLMGGPPLVGMESLVGSEAEVVRWEGDHGTVRIAGSLWNARSVAAVSAGAGVVITGHDGMTVVVAPAPVRQ